MQERAVSARMRSETLGVQSSRNVDFDGVANNATNSPGRTSDPSMLSQR